MFTIVFLIALCCLFVVATVLTEIEQFGWATVVLIASLVGAHVFHVVNVLSWVQTHSFETLLYALAYVGVGVVWSFVKWFSFLMAFRDKFRTLKEAFLSARNLDVKGSVPEELRDVFAQYIRNSKVGYHDSYGLSFLIRPRATENKSRIVSWMSLWPCSVIGTLLNDPVRRLFNWMFTAFKSLYERMTNHIFRSDVELK